MKKREEVSLPQMQQKSLYTNPREQHQMLQLHTKNRDMRIVAKRNGHNGSRMTTELYQEQETPRPVKVKTEVQIGGNTNGSEEVLLKKGVSKEDFITFL